MPQIWGKFERPASLRSGETLAQKVIVQHRSDVLLEEQIQNVSSVQEALQRALLELQCPGSRSQTASRRNLVRELKLRSDEMMLILKVVQKLNSELVYARADVHKALKYGGDITCCRKRVNWLEDRMEQALLTSRRINQEKETCKSSTTGELASQERRDELRVRRKVDGSGDAGSDTARMVGTASDSASVIERKTKGTPEFDERLKTTDSVISKTPSSKGILKSRGTERHSRLSDVATITEHLAAGDSQCMDGEICEVDERSTKDNSSISSLQRSVAHSNRTHQRSIAEDSQQASITDSSSTLEAPPMAIDVSIFKPTHRTPDVSELKEEEVEEKQVEELPSLLTDRSSSSSSSDESLVDAGRAKSEPIFLTEEPHMSEGRRSKSSRVTLRTPAEVEETPIKREEITEETYDPSLDYWNSEHHRFEYSDYLPQLLELDPLSYHQMGLAAPGSFVESPPGTSAVLPWRSKRRGSEPDIHERALNKLSVQVHNMYGTVREASMLSVNHNEQTFKAPKFLQQFETDGVGRGERVSWRRSVKFLVNATSKAKAVQSKATMAKCGLIVPSTKGSIDLPPVEHGRIGSSFSGRLVFHAKPLLHPEKLPLTRTVQEKVYPPLSDCYSNSLPGKVAPAERIVDQGNLLEETKFSSTLYRSKPEPSGAAYRRESHIRRLLDDDRPTSQADRGKKVPSLKKAFSLAHVAVKLQGNKWKSMKPKSGALDHSGLKWERVKDIVHNSLQSPKNDERVDAAKHLGMLKCGDTMVLYALKERLKNDSEERVKYECLASLILLGCWDEEILQKLVYYLLNGNQEIRADLLKTMTHGKNVQYVDKKTKTFPELSSILSLLCNNTDPQDEIGVNAAVCLGRLCVADKHATDKLKNVMQDSTDSHVKAEALSLLVKHLCLTEWSIVAAILNQLHRSPVWKHRRDAAKLLIYLGPDHVCLDTKTEEVFMLLEWRLWDDPIKDVRLEVAKVLAALGMYPRACEKVEKKLEDSDHEIRTQGVIAVGTLGMKHERVLRTLLDMLELDPCENVRFMILKTFAALNSTDKRIIRALKDKEKLKGRLGKEAAKSLNILGATSSKAATGKMNGRVLKMLTMAK